MQVLHLDVLAEMHTLTHIPALNGCLDPAPSLGATSLEDF